MVGRSFRNANQGILVGGRLISLKRCRGFQNCATLPAVGRKDFQSFEEVLRSVAEQKAAAAKAHLAGTDPAAEKPRDVYLGACEAIAQSLAPHGFRYLKSRQALDRTVGAFVHHVSFQSSHNNIAGQSVVMWMHANVRCKELARWRSQQSSPLRTDDWVAGGMVHNLTREHAMIEWQLADPTSRSATIANGQEFAGTIVLGYLALFEDPQQTVSELLSAPLNAFSIGDQIEFVLCFAGPREANQILQRFVDHRSDLHTQMHRAKERVEREGLPEYPPSAYADVVAWVGKAYGLEVVIH